VPLRITGDHRVSSGVHNTKDAVHAIARGLLAHLGDTASDGFGQTSGVGRSSTAERLTSSSVASPDQVASGSPDAGATGSGWPGSTSTSDVCHTGLSPAVSTLNP
jgi:hypothetical protein